MTLLLALAALGIFGVAAIKKMNAAKAPATPAPNAATPASAPAVISSSHDPAAQPVYFSTGQTLTSPDLPNTTLPVGGQGVPGGLPSPNLDASIGEPSPVSEGGGPAISYDRTTGNPMPVATAASLSGIKAVAAAPNLYGDEIDLYAASLAATNAPGEIQQGPQSQSSVKQLSPIGTATAQQQQAPGGGGGGSGSGGSGGGGGGDGSGGGGTGGKGGILIT